MARALLGYGIGLDDVYQDPPGFTRRIEKVKPDVVCFNSKGAQERIAVIEPGEDWRGVAAQELVVFDGVRLVWALPDSSGRASAFHTERIELLRQLRQSLFSGQGT